MEKEYLENKLKDLRARWVKASPSYKLFIEQGASLLKKKLLKLEKEKEKKERMKLF